jgi:DNA-binding transcriptional ArsR family regulator
MASDTSPFPHRPPTDVETQSERTVALGTDEAVELCTALGNETAMDIVACLGEAPTNASALAEAVGTSLQNVDYHLEKLRAAGVVEAVDTWYSSRGSAMTVYALCSERLALTPSERAPTAAEE